MGKIDLSINKVGLEHNIQKAKENNVIIPTIAQMQHPETIPEKIQAKLKNVGLWDVNPLNLFRITWKNEAKESGGLFQEVPNYVEIPSELSGVPCRIIAMAGKWFPTGCHKVGASFGCLAPRLVTGQFDANYHHAVWPSTGNYCRGGAFNSKLLAVDSVAILPAEMSKERFDWLSKIAGQVIATPGCESNVKEIFDKTWELKQDPSMMIFNQFEEMGNPLWHYNVTGYALADLFEAVKKPGQNFAGACFTSGSAGTMSAGDLLKERYPGLKLGVGEALQCPTILENGFGGHRIEGIGDKHIPWIHNVKNTDMAIAIDDEDSQRLLRLFNTKEGQKYLKEELKLYQKGDKAGIDALEKKLLAQNAEHKDWACTEEMMKLTKDGKALYLHCLPADISGLSCPEGEVDNSVFDRYIVPLYKQASYKPYIIAAMIFLAQVKDPVRALMEMDKSDAERKMF